MKKDRAFKFIFTAGITLIILVICTITSSSSTPSGEHVVVRSDMDVLGGGYTLIHPLFFVLDIETGEFVLTALIYDQLIIKSIKITTPVDQTECIITTPLPIDNYPYPDDSVSINGKNCFLSEDEFDGEYASLNVEITYDIISKDGKVYQENITERGSIKFVTSRIHEIEEKRHKYRNILAIISIVIIIGSAINIAANIGKTKESLDKYLRIFNVLMLIFCALVLSLQLGIISIESVEAGIIARSILFIMYTVSLIILLCSIPFVKKYYGIRKMLSQILLTILLALLWFFVLSMWFY